MTPEPQRTSSADYEPALHTLLSIYHERTDVQSSFPEAADWDFRGLIGWAVQVAQGNGDDPATAKLRPYVRWYEQNNVSNVSAGEVPWQDWEASWNVAQSSSPMLFRGMQDFTRTAFNQHLVTLLMLVTEFGLRRIVELGTQYGHSTLALLEAAKRIDGRVFSIDVEPCSEANAHVQSFGLSSHWSFLHGNALSFAPPAFPDQLDLVFIDTFHLFSQTMRELNHFEPYLAPKSWIVLHDAVTFPGVSRAVNEFMMKYPRRFRFYPYIHQHGLLVLRSN